MGELSQAEIDALLGGGLENLMSEQNTANFIDTENVLTSEQKDILGEIGNISMGTSATTLFALLGQKVWITTPKVKTLTWKQLSESYDRPCVGIRVDYKEGLRGSNILILKQHDVKIIANLMMGNDGNVPEGAELDDIDLSAIGEAMNQMVGSSSTSLSSMIKMKIDIDTPHAFKLDFNNDDFFDTIGFAPDEIIACISFKMEIGTLIDSEIMQILPSDFAIEMVETLKNEMMGGGSSTPAATTAAPTQAATPQYQQPQQQYDQQYQQQPQMQYDQQQQYQQQQQQQMYQQQPYQQQPYQQQQPYPQQQQMNYQQPYPQQQQMYYQPQQDMYAQPMQQQQQKNVNVQPVQFQSFDAGSVMQQKENIGIIMDVPLEVTVELGRTRKKIKDILEFTPGTIIELDKLAGEAIDILVNGKFVAKGEVVVIDESFGIRITDIISVESRI